MRPPGLLVPIANERFPTFGIDAQKYAAVLLVPSGFQMPADRFAPESAYTKQMLG
ncbi:MAG: hypothetical protein ACR2JB_11020 [Bryobacteraceae bacterium]